MQETDINNLVNRCKSGDISAFSQIYEKSKDRVFSLAKRMVKNDQDAEDLTHDIFVKAYREIKKYEGRSKFSTWLYQIAVNTCSNFLKRKKIIRFLPFTAKSETVSEERLSEPEAYAQTVDEQALFEKLLSEIDLGFRACIILKDIEGLSYDEIASILDIPTGTAMSRTDRARQKLRELYQIYGMK